MIAIVVAVIAIVAAVIAIVLVLRQSTGQPPSDELLRSRLALSVTSGAMLFIGFMAGLVLICAGLNALLPPSSPQKITLFFDIVKYLLTALLPVVAGWVGTVLQHSITERPTSRRRQRA